MESYQIKDDRDNGKKIQLWKSLENGVDYFKDWYIEILITNNDKKGKSAGQTLKVLHNYDGQTLINVSSSKEKLFVEGLYLKRKDPC